MNNSDLQVRFCKETEQQVLQTGKQMNLYYTDEYVRWLESKVLQQSSGVKSENGKALHIHGVNEADYCSKCSLKHKAPDKDKLKIIAADGSEVAVCKFTRACLFKGSIKYCRTNNKKCEHSVSKLNTNVDVVWAEF